MSLFREHLLLGSEEFGTLITGCGRVPEKVRDEYAIGPNLVNREDEYVRLRGIAMMHMCGGCERAWRRNCRERNQEFTPTARDRERAEGA
jgi:hypothetical protein